jgi:hypothetical protein
MKEEHLPREQRYTISAIAIGDWEIDTIVGKNNRGAIVTMAERKSACFATTPLSEKRPLFMNNYRISIEKSLSGFRKVASRFKWTFPDFGKPPFDSNGRFRISESCFAIQMDVSGFRKVALRFKWMFPDFGKLLFN